MKIFLVKILNNVHREKLKLNFYYYLFNTSLLRQVRIYRICVLYCTAQKPEMQLHYYTIVCRELWVVWSGIQKIFSYCCINHKRDPWSKEEDLLKKSRT